MSPLNIVENSDKVIEINHHLAHLNSHHYNDWTSPRDLFNMLLYHHAPGSSSSHYLQFPPQDSPGGLGYHHSHNEAHLGNTTPGSSHSGLSPPSLIDETEEESLIVVYALFLPLLAALIFILIVALYVRRMRRSTSMQNVEIQNEVHDFSLEQMKGPSKNSSSNRGNNSHSSSSSTTSQGDDKKKKSQSRASSMKTNTKSSLKAKSIYTTRSISSMGLSWENSNQNGEDKYKSYNYQLEQLQNQQQRGKRWNSSGFLNSNSNDDDSGGADNYGYSGSEIEIVRPDTCVVDLGVDHSPSQNSHADLKRSSSSTSSSRKNFKSIGRFLGIINVPKRIKQNNMEKKRFNIYTIPLETREQLKQIYVY